MKFLILTLLLMTSLFAIAQDGKARTVKKTFNRSTSISQYIDAPPSTVWSLLTNVKDYSRWNSTIISIEGKIQEGEKIKLKSTLDLNRTFKLKVKKLIKDKKLVWGDRLGTRTYILEKSHLGTKFSMTETIGGLMFPLFAKKIPSFDGSFEQFTLDLKREAEKFTN